MRTLENSKAILPFAFLVATTMAAHSALLIYEPFDDSDSTLNGNTPGTGLTGTWSAEGGLDIAAGSLSWGSLATSGNRAISSSGNFRDSSVSTGTTLSGGGHLSDGVELWFSALGNAVAGSGNRSYLTLGTGKPDGFDRIGGNTGFGLGVRLENNTVHAHGWNGGSAVKPAGTAVSAGTVFVVGKITWAPGGSNDTLEIFLPGTDLVLPGTAASTLTADFDQSVFTTLGFAVHPSPNNAFDEIRFGTSYADVAPVPEPSSTALLGLGGVVLILRRRK